MPAAGVRTVSGQAGVATQQCSASGGVVRRTQPQLDGFTTAFSRCLTTRSQTGLLKMSTDWVPIDSTTKRWECCANERVTRHDFGSCLKRTSITVFDETA
jgi:hypothetical protein